MSTSIAQSKLFLPPHLQDKQMIPTKIALAAMEKALKAQRRNAMLLFRKILSDPLNTPEKMIATIDELLAENEKY